MKDVLPTIAGLLEEIADTELSFSDNPRTLPCIILSETENASYVMLSSRDRYSIITLQTDIYGTDESNARDIAGEVNDALAAKGIKRTFSEFITNEDAPRMCMRFRFGLDEETGRVVSL